MGILDDLLLVLSRKLIRLGFFVFVFVFVFVFLSLDRCISVVP